LHYEISETHIQALQPGGTKEKERSGKKLGPLQRIEKEDEINDWLEQNGLQGYNITGETFVDAGFTGQELESIRNGTNKEAFANLLLWIENLLSSQRTIKDLEEASTGYPFGGCY
jgi:hypothetical protein